MRRPLLLLPTLFVAACTAEPAFELDVSILVDPAQDPLADAFDVRLLFRYPGGVVHERTVPAHGGDAAVEDLPPGEDVVLVVQGIGREAGNEVVVALGRSAPFTLGPDAGAAAVFVARPDSITQLPFELEQPRAFATATWTPGDRVVVVGGGDWDSDSIAPVELLGADTSRPYAPLGESIGDLDRIGHAAFWVGSRGGAWDAQVAVFGGTRGAGIDSLAGAWDAGIDRIALIDPAAATLTEADEPLPVPLMDSRIVETDQGLLALVGGYFSDGAAATYATRIYLVDPRGEDPEWMSEPVIVPREQHAVTAIPGELEARFLVTGGFQSEQGLDGSGALWSGAPAVDATPLPAGSLVIPRARHRATLLGSGKVLLTGGATGAANSTSLGTPLGEAELFDPDDGQFTQVPSGLTVPRQRHVATAIAGDRVLICGGQGPAGNAEPSCEIYQAGTGIFEPFDGVLDPGGPGVAVAEYPDGRRLFVGGAELPGAPGGGLSLYMPPSFVD